MTPQLLRSSGVGRDVNRASLKESPHAGVAGRSLALLEKWRRLIRRRGAPSIAGRTDCSRAGGCVRGRQAHSLAQSNGLE
eukprot:8227078-Alexandrium_andersonii.AAC.1